MNDTGLASEDLISAIGVLLVLICAAFLTIAAVVAIAETVRNLKKSKLASSAMAERLSSVLATRRGTSVLQRLVSVSPTGWGRRSSRGAAMGGEHGGVEMQENPMRRQGNGGSSVTGSAAAASATVAATEDPSRAERWSHVLELSARAAGTLQENPLNGRPPEKEAETTL